jgi:hypothetical protein
MTQAAMTPGTAALLLFGSFFTLIALRVPVAVALGLACRFIAGAHQPARSKRYTNYRADAAYNDHQS